MGMFLYKLLLQNCPSFFPKLLKLRKIFAVLAFALRATIFIIFEALTVAL